MELRLGTVPYLNARPLVEGLADEPGVTLDEDVPAVLARRLLLGHVDAALVSAIELFRARGLGWIAGPAVTSEGPVRSILLFLRTAPEDVRSLALDASSLTANALARICLADVHGVDEPEVTSAPPDMPLDAVDADAILRIGDPALLTDPGDRAVLDLGEVWTAHTGLPFVYALWLVAPGTPAAEVAALVRAARERGLPRRAEIARRLAARDGLDPDAAERYLTGCIGFDLGTRERAGLETFGRLAAERGLATSPELPPPLA